MIRSERQQRTIYGCPTNELLATEHALSIVSFRLFPLLSSIFVEENHNAARLGTIVFEKIDWATKKCGYCRAKKNHMPKVS
jgi:hypothetical protein